MTIGSSTFLSSGIGGAEIHLKYSSSETESNLETRIQNFVEKISVLKIVELET